MSTTVMTRPASGTSREATQKEAAVPAQDFWSMLEEYRLGLLPAFLLIVACVGGIAAAFASWRGENTLVVVALAAVLSEGFVIALAPMKAVFWVSVIAIIADVIAILV